MVLEEGGGIDDPRAVAVVITGLGVGSSGTAAAATAESLLPIPPLPPPVPLFISVDSERAVWGSWLLPVVEEAVVGVGVIICCRGGCRLVD